MSLLYRVGIKVVAAHLRLSGCIIHGKENIPEDKPILIIANHTSFGDPPVLAAVFPRPITFMAKSAFTKNVWTRSIFGNLGVVFLDEKDNDFTALKAVLRLLKQGKTVGIFPEGTRHRDQVLGEFKTGAAFIGAKAKVSVLPVALLNTKDYWRFWKRNLVVNIGQEIPYMEDSLGGQKALQDKTVMYHDTIAALLAEAQELLLMKKANSC